MPGPNEPDPKNNSIDRRTFLVLSALTLAAAAAPSLLAACAAPAATPAAPTPAKEPATVPAAPGPAAQGGMTVMDALKNRKSTNGFKTDPLPRNTMLELLWAGWGINRPDSGKRTAPTAINAQEIDIYILQADGVYLYDAKANQISQVLNEDLRPRTSFQSFMRDAPAHLVFVADFSRLHVAHDKQPLFSYCHTGSISQNVYLYCAANGLGAHIYDSVDRAGIKDKLKLRDDQMVILGQAIGYPSS